MGELHAWPKDPLSCADPETCFDLHAVPPGYQPIGEGDYGYLAQYNQAYFGWVELVSLDGSPPRRRNIRMRTYSERNLLALTQLARPWQQNLLLFSV